MNVQETQMQNIAIGVNTALGGVPHKTMQAPK